MYFSITISTDNSYHAHCLMRIAQALDEAEGFVLAFHGHHDTDAHFVSAQASTEAGDLMERTVALLASPEWPAQVMRF